MKKKDLLRWSRLTSVKPELQAELVVYRLDGHPTNIKEKIVTQLGDDLEGDADGITKLLNFLETVYGNSQHRPDETSCNDRHTTVTLEDTDDEDICLLTFSVEELALATKVEDLRALLDCACPTTVKWRFPRHCHKLQYSN